MKHNKRAQTATEYLVILAIIIIIALIVVSVLGGIPGIGGSIAQQQAQLELSMQRVGIVDYSVSPVKTVFTLRNNEPNTIRIESIRLGDRDCWLQGTHNVPKARPQLRAGESRQVQCNTVVASDDFSLDVEITYTDIRTSAQFKLNTGRMVGSPATFNCPDGFVPVPGGFVLADGSTVDDFCVMKYEAKAMNASGDIVEDGGVTDDIPHWADDSYTPVSVAEGRPWVRIAMSDPEEYDALEACQSLGPGYDLITDQQWMVMAENIWYTTINDMGGASNVRIARGHSDDSPSNSIAAGTTPVISGCNLNVPMNHTDNAFVAGSCEIRGNGTSSHGYTGTGNNWNGEYGTGGRKDQLRTHVLSNGQVIWDVAGNVQQWTNSAQYGIDTTGTGWHWHDYTDTSLSYTYFEWMRPSIQFTGSASGMGRFYQNNAINVDRAPRRGGSWHHGVSAGVFYVATDIAPSSPHSDAGFRCVYSPGG